jgi:uncharacterized protein (TIGR03067 family)
MRILLIVFAACLPLASTSAAAATPAPGDKAPTRSGGADDAAKVQGEWKCAQAVVDGKALTKEAAAKLRLFMTAQGYRTERGDEVLFDSTYQLDPKSEPKQIQMIGTEGDAAGKPALGIYSLEGDTLKICYTMPGRERPRTFESKPGSNAFLATWTRVRK